MISCLGLLGLAAYSAEQRTKEIGIRKILGASVGKLFLFQSFEFLKLLIISNVIAWPISYVIMTKVLDKYAYRTTIGLEIFLSSSLIAFIIAFIIISFQTIKSSLANPVDSLRYE